MFAVRETRPDGATLKRLLEITHDILQAQSLASALESIARGVAELFGFKYVTIVAADQPGGEMFRLALFGFTDEIVNARMGEHVPRTDITSVLNSDYEVVENCYYIPAEREFPWARSIYTGDLPQDAPRAARDAWHERDTLIHVIPDRSGEMLGYMSVDHPLNGRVPSGEMLREMQLFVNLVGLALVSSRTFAAEVAQRRMLEENTRQQNEFFSMVAHEVRSPLAAIRGATSLLETHFDAMKGERRDELMKVLGSSTARLSSIFEDFLLLSRMDAGKLTLRITAVDALQLAEESVARMQSEHPERQFRAVCLSPLPMVRADEGRVVQILTNLLSNAAKYSNPDSVVALEIKPADDRIQFSVKNEGPGISEDDREKLFTRFGRLSKSDDSFSTGLGLYISAQLTQLMGGSIGCESIPGKVTTFWFTLPRAENTEAVAS
ncbi:MAG: HAMP domain-containing histidine kinase [Candidatus Eremiobacteraeota bacterium]|nr:HAMP domain-containing histidine kinase [Candidatus Eremiobacteraeota bacterium]